MSVGVINSPCGLRFGDPAGQMPSQRVRTMRSGQPAVEPSADLAALGARLSSDARRHLNRWLDCRAMIAQLKEVKR